MRPYLTILFLFFSYTAWPQLLYDRDVRKLKSFGMDLSSLDARDQRVWDDVREIINKDAQCRRRITTGIILAALSVGPITSGSVLLSDPYHPFQYLFGTLVLTSGALLVGVSIPLFISVKHKAWQRGKLIRDYYRHY